MEKKPQGVSHQAGSFQSTEHRKFEMTVKKELEGDEKSSTKAAIPTQSDPLGSLAEEHMSKKLLPEFAPERVVDKRKNKLVFHAEETKQGKSKLVVIPTGEMPDHESHRPQLPQIPRKTHSNKDKCMKTNKMQEPHVSSIGVVPIRNSLKIKDLKVVLQGCSPAFIDELASIDMVKKANTLCPSPIFVQPSTSESHLIGTDKKSEVDTKLALLTTTGTVQPLKVHQIRKPLQQYKVCPTKLRSSILSATGSKLKKEITKDSVIKVLESGTYKSKDLKAGPLAFPIGHSKCTTSSTDIKSAKGLLEEARLISGVNASGLDRAKPSESEEEIISSFHNQHDFKDSHLQEMLRSFSESSGYALQLSETKIDGGNSGKIDKASIMDSSGTMLLQEEKERKYAELKQAILDLNAPEHVTYEDLVGIIGKPVPELLPEVRKTKRSVSPAPATFSYLLSWAEKPADRQKQSDSREDPKSFHHFCTVTDTFQIPHPLLNVPWKYHTPNRLNRDFKAEEFQESMSCRSQSGMLKKRQVNMIETPVITETMADSQKKELDRPESEMSFEDWQKKAKQIIAHDDTDFLLQGKHLDIKDHDLIFYWTPAPPKLAVLPGFVKSILCPTYMDREELEQHQKVKALNLEGSMLENTIKKVMNLNVERKKPPKKEDPLETAAEHKKMLDFLNRRKAVKRLVSPEVLSQIDKARKKQQVSEIIFEIVDEELKDVEVKNLEAKTLLDRELKSAHALYGNKDTSLVIPSDFDATLFMMEKQKKVIKRLKDERLAASKEKDAEQMPTEQVEKIPNTKKEELPKEKMKIIVKDKANGKSTKSGKKGKKFSKRTSKLVQKTVVAQRKIEFLEVPTRKLSRSMSLPYYCKTDNLNCGSASLNYVRCSKSLSSILKFEEYCQMNNITETDVREQVRSIWEEWFDEVYPPTPKSSLLLKSDFIVSDVSLISGEKNIIESKESDTSILTESIDYLDMSSKNPEKACIQELFNEEIENLTQSIESSDYASAFWYCRRGALYVKVGKMKLALEDLNRAIEMEPELLDAYFHRHIIYYLQGKYTQAINDLICIIKQNKLQIRVYIALGKSYLKQGNLAMSILNYTEAIQMDPTHHMAYFFRGEAYEMLGETTLAMENFVSSTIAKPTFVEGLMKQAIFYFNCQNWLFALNILNNVIGLNPMLAEAYLHRGKVLMKMYKNNLALKDICHNIHLAPNSWEAFFLRAFLLRSVDPKRALQDYSVSILLNSEDANCAAFFHRGILYNSLGLQNAAISDFEIMLKMDQEKVSALICLGLIYFKHYQSYYRAIEQFSAAISFDPHNVQAYMYRIEVNMALHQLQLALKDYSRIIHLYPTNYHIYLFRSKLLMMFGKWKEASENIKQVADAVISGDFVIHDPFLLSQIFSFVKYYDEAIKILKDIVRPNSSVETLILLANIQIQAARYLDAVETLDSAYQILKSVNIKSQRILAAEMFYLYGICYLEIYQLEQAISAFNKAIKLNDHYPEAYYQRGQVYLKQNNEKALEDLNKALMLNPNFFQAYLTRACYFVMKKNYTMAILNCNEALMLQPQSVRGFLYRGTLKYIFGVYDLAIKDLTAAVSIDPMCYLAFFNRAITYVAAKQPEQALQDYCIVLMLTNELNFQVFINQGLLYFNMKNYLNALYKFEAALKMSPYNCEIYHAIGFLYHRLGMLEKSFETFNKCLQLNPFHIKSLLNRGYIQFDYDTDERFAAARRDYQLAIHMDPTCMEARLGLAYCLQLTGKFMAAWRQVTSTIEIDPEHQAALDGRAIINLQMSNLSGAFQDICMAIRIKATAELLTNRGVINLFMNNPVDAMTDFQRALQLDPSYSLAYFNAANVYFHTRHFKQALAYYDKAILHNEEDESAYINRAITKVMLKDFKGALTDFDMAANFTPNSAHLHFNRGNLYASLNQYSEAEQEYTCALDVQPDDFLTLRRRADVLAKLGQKERAIRDYKRALEIKDKIAAQ